MLYVALGDACNDRNCGLPLIGGSMNKLPNIHPMKISQNKLANAMSVPLRCINEIVHGKRRITALRLAVVLGTSEKFWLDLK